MSFELRVRVYAILAAVAIALGVSRSKGDACRWRMRDYWIPREALSQDNPMRKQWPLETLVRALKILPVVENRLVAAAAAAANALKPVKAAESARIQSRASTAAKHSVEQLLSQKFDIPASVAASFRGVILATIKEQRTSC